MKEIRMDWDTYQAELEGSEFEAYESGYNDAFTEIIKWISSGTTPKLFFGDDFILTSQWEKLALMIGRQT